MLMMCSLSVKIMYIIVNIGVHEILFDEIVLLRNVGILVAFHESHNLRNREERHISKLFQALDPNFADVFAMNDAHREVEAWLSQLFVDESIPSYEVNERSIDLLYSLMKSSERSDLQTQHVIDDYWQQAEEYGSEARRLRGVLHSVGLTTASLSQSGVISLQALTKLASLLQVSDGSDTSFLLSLLELSEEIAEAEAACRREQLAYNQLCQQTTASLTKYNSLKKAIQVIEGNSQKAGTEMENHQQSAAFYKSKAQNYAKEIRKLEAKLHGLGLKPSLYHKELVKKSENLQSLKDEVSKLRTKVSAYHSLPPNVSLSLVKVKEAKQTIAELEAEISKKIDLQHL